MTGDSNKGMVALPSARCCRSKTLKGIRQHRWENASFREHISLPSIFLPELDPLRGKE